MKPDFQKTGSACLQICCVFLFVHLLTFSRSGKAELAAALVLLIIASAAAIVLLKTDKNHTAHLSVTLIAMGLGFWCFSVFRYVGLVKWPMNPAENIREYMMLLYYHFVLVFTVLSAIIAAKQLTGQKRPYRLNIRKNNLPVSQKWLLVLTASAFWLWALYRIGDSGVIFTGTVIGLVLTGLIKALLNGFAEEICYRGFIQSAAEKSYGISGGILFQAIIFTMFHMYLGPAFFSGGLFITSVFCAGILFGIVTRFSSGIGWACAVHSAFNMVVEWKNLSLTY